MAPELLRGAPPSVSSDLYAVGLLLHQMLTGTFPSDKPSVGGMLDELLADDAAPAAVASPPDDFMDAFGDDNADEFAPRPPQPLTLSPELSPPLRDILARVLAPDPEDRYGDANLVLRELAHAVAFELPVETAATRESFLRATMLVGRDTELATLKLALNRTKQGHGTALLIGGESGVGKSRLIAELRTLALVHGSWVAEGQSVTDGGYYYQEWLPVLRALCFRGEVADAEAEILKDLLPDIATLIGHPIADPPPSKPEAALARLTNTVVGLLKRQTKPLLLVLEDLQWVRSESQALLLQICKAVPELPLLVVGTYRSDERPNLPQTLPEARVIQLHRLTPQGIALLSESMLGPVGRQPQLIDYLTRQTDGNSFFLVEVVRALAENAGELERIGQGELPENVITVGIERIVERRLEQMAAHYLPLLKFSATLGRKLDLAALGRVFPEVSQRDFLIDGANGAVLESQGLEWRFAHDKLRETILKRMDRDQRQQQHRQVAEALEDIYTDKQREPLFAVLAQHYKEAGVVDKAFHYFVQAGDLATELFAYEQARNQYADAAQLLGALPESSASARVRIDLLLKQVKCSQAHTPPAVNQARISQARELLETVPTSTTGRSEDRLRAARLDFYDARLLNYSGKPAQAIPFFRKVLPVAQECGEQELVIESALFIGYALIAQGHFAKAEALLAPLPVQFMQLNGTDIDTLRAYGFHACSMAATGKYQQSRAILNEMASWLDGINQASYRNFYYMAESLIGLMAGEWSAAIAGSLPVVSSTDNTVESMQHVVCCDASAWAHSQLGMHQTALLHRARSMTRRVAVGGGVLGDWFEAGEAEFHLNAGRNAEALEQAKKTVVAYQPRGFLFGQAVAERVWGCALYRLGGDTAEADEHFRKSLALMETGGMVTQSLQTELWWGHSCRARGERAAAEEHWTRARALFTDEMAPRARAEALAIIAGAPIPVVSGPENQGADKASR